MKTTVLDRLIMELRVWPENTDYIAGNNGWLWRYKTTGGVSGGPLKPAIPAPSDDPTGRVTKEQWLLAASAKTQASGDRGIGACFFLDEKGRTVFAGGLRGKPAPKLSAAARKYVDEFLEEAYETGLTECPFETDSEDFDAVSCALSGLRFKLDDVTDPNVIAWRGEGLPPVGAETKYRVIGSRHNPKWLYARILYISDDWVVFADDKGVEHCEPLRGFVFRRYVSPEERKQNAVNAMRKVVESASLEGNTTPGCLDALYAALIAGEIPGLPGEEAE